MGRFAVLLNFGGCRRVSAQAFLQSLVYEKRPRSADRGRFVSEWYCI